MLRRAPAMDGGQPQRTSQAPDGLAGERNLVDLQELLGRMGVIEALVQAAEACLDLDGHLHR